MVSDELSAQARSGRDLASRKRKATYLGLLRERAMTINEVSKASKIPYSTCYREMQQLAKTFQIYPTGSSKGKADLYRCGSPDNAPPDLFISALARPVPLIEFLKAQANDNWKPPKSAIAANEFAQLILLYLELATKLANGQSVTKADVDLLRSSFVKNRNLLTTQVNLLDQMIENDKRWEINELRRIGQLPEHSTEDLEPIINSFNASLAKPES